MGCVCRVCRQLSRTWWAAAPASLRNSIKTCKETPTRFSRWGGLIVGRTGSFCRDRLLVYISGNPALGAAFRARLVNLYTSIQYLVFVAIVTILVKPLGSYMERVFSRERTGLDRLCLPVERLIYRITAVDPDLEMTGTEYATCFVLFGLAGTLLLYGILRLQQFLPWFFPLYHTTPLSPDLALNTAISFSTTTTWQAYAGENTMSYFSQMLGLCAQNFLAGAAGLAVGIAFIRGLSRQHSEALGNFWVDLTRSLLWILLPGALVGALLLVWQGVPMNFRQYTVATTVEGAKQVIPQGPVAALEIIKN